MSDLHAQLAAALGPGFRLERELGGGGMSRVFLAEELALGRRVVVKMLPPEFAADSGAERFQRETRVVASLQHPNIVPIITAGGDANLLWFTMPFIEGESLRDRLTREGELPVGEAVRLWAEILDALAYAHSRGIVHRDIKPENVLLSGRHALVADFGIARALSSAAGARATATGLAIGTPAYMSPEQAVGDPNVDVRADLYSAALVMYEMLTGVMPFNERSPARLIVAHASQPVPPVRERRPQVSPALEALLLQCLEKRPADRPQTADEVLRALGQISDASLGTQPSGERAATAPAARAPARAASRARHLVLAGVAIAAVAGAALGVQAWRERRAAPASVIDSARVAVLLMPSVYEPADSLLASSGLELIRAAIKNDRRLALVDPIADLPPGADARVMAGVRSRDSLLRWSPDFGVHTQLTYSLTRAGSGYLLGVSVRGVRNDSSLYAKQVPAATAGELPAAAERLAQEVSAALGRAFGNLRRPDPDGKLLGIGPDAARALRDADLDFLRRDYAEAAAKYRTVLRVDSTLSEVWLRLSFALGNAALQRDERLRAMSAAYRHRGTLPFSSVRRMIEWEYLRFVQDWPAATARFQEMQRAGQPVNENNYGLLLANLRRFDEATRLYTRLRDTTYQILTNPASNYVVALLDEGRLADADAEVDRMEAAQSPTHPVVMAARQTVVMATRNADSLLAVARAQQPHRRGPTQQLGNLNVQRIAEFGRGALGAAMERQGERRAIYREQGLVADGLESDLLFLADRAQLLGDTPELRAELAAMYSRAAFDALAPLDRPWGAAISALALLGRVEEARALSAEADRTIPDEWRLSFQISLATARLNLALVSGDAQDALAQARLRDRGACVPCAYAGYARAWDAAGNADSALVNYDRYLDATSSRVFAEDATYYAPFLVRSGELREARGDVAGAIARYRAFVERWRNADPALQSRVKDVEARIARLEARRG